MRSRAHSNVLSAVLVAVVAIAAALSQPLPAAAAADADADEGTISGTVTVPADFNAWDVRVRAHPEGTQGVTSSRDVEGYPDEDGAYTLHAPAGRYKLEFDYMDSRGDLLADRWYPNAPTEAAGSWVSVVAGSSQTIDATMAVATNLGTIRGTATWPNGTPAADVSVRLWHPNEYDDWDSMYLQRLGADGTFEFRMRPGTYLLQVDDSPNLESEFWENATEFDDAQPITVTSGSTAVTDVQLECKAACVTASIAVPSGGPKVGQTLTASVQNWNPIGTTTGYVWMRDGVEIATAETATYVLTSADLGKRISVRVTDNGWMGEYPYVEASVTSPRTAAVTAGTLTAPTPTLTGTASVGQVLTLNAGNWGPSGVSLTRQWQRGNGTDWTTIAGATGTTYTLTSADVDQQIRATVTGNLTGYTTTTKASAATATIAPGALTAPTPTITGSARVGQVLTVNAGSWGPSGVSLTRQWQRGNGTDWTTIAGATGTTYTLTSADVDQQIRATVTGNLTAYTTTTKASAATATIAPGALTAPTPTITGTARVGHVLTVNAGSWPAGTTVGYQWLRNGAPIAGARGRTYSLSAADVNRTISVRVSGSATGYATTTRTASARTVRQAVSRTTATVKRAKRAATFRVRVTATGTTPTGKVTIKLGKRVVKKGTLKNGQIVLKGTKLKKGKRTFTIVYAGSRTVAASSVRKTVRIN